MGTGYNGPDDRPTKVQRLYGNCSLCGLHNKDGPLCPLYKGGDSVRVRQDICPHSLLTLWSPRGDHLAQDLRFANKFWTSQFNLLGTDLQFSTAFHP